MRIWILLLLILILYPVLSKSQIYIGFSQTDSAVSVEDSITAFSDSQGKPDADRNDIPFIDYFPAVIWDSPHDSISDYAYIRKNFTDQMVSVWNHPKRLYPASRIYAVDMQGKHYRAVNVSKDNYVFAEQIVSGKMELYIYRKIPQVYGWVEYVGRDSNGEFYHNNMIVEQEEMRSKKEYFGYFISLGGDTLHPVSTSTLQIFIDNYLSETPAAKAKAMKFTGKNGNKAIKIFIAGLMTAGLLGLASSGGSGAGSVIFFAAIPVAGLLVYLNRPHTLHWQDMVEIVETYNLETGSK